ncbi:MAG: hypothetical protein IK051_02025 [Rhodocyclaceae bacterium]|nr:hypothetical protein [Rhodocyclaceae bacterium]
MSAPLSLAATPDEITQEAARREQDARLVRHVLIAALAVIFLLTAIVSLWQWQRYNTHREELAPRIARLQGLLGARDALQSTAANARAAAARYAYPASMDIAHAESDFQSQVRQLFQQAGMSIANTRQLPTREQEESDLLQLELDVTGSLPQLNQVLHKLPKLAPFMRVDSLRLLPLRPATAQQPDPEQTLNIQIRISCNRLRGGEA